MTPKDGTTAQAYDITWVTPSKYQLSSGHQCRRAVCFHQRTPSSSSHYSQNFTRINKSCVGCKPILSLFSKGDCQLQRPQFAKRNLGKVLSKQGSKSLVSAVSDFWRPFCLRPQWHIFSLTVAFFHSPSTLAPLILLILLLHY